MDVDFIVYSEGGYSLLEAKTEAAQDWCEENLHWSIEQVDGKYVIENCDGGDISRSIGADGLWICLSGDEDLDQERH